MSVIWVGCVSISTFHRLISQKCATDSKLCQRHQLVGTSLGEHCRRHTHTTTSRAKRDRETRMKWSALVLSSLAATASAFAPANRAFVTRSAPRFNTAINANVLKLSSPVSQILDKTDVFIFDCDGVIWRVSLLACVCVFCGEG